VAEIVRRKAAPVDQSQADIETHLVDLQDMPLDALRNCDPKQFSPYLERLLRQVTRPRYNLGGAGPPGRVD
jgi:hypothetical protein